MEYKDYYAILEIDKTSSVEEITSAHRKLARKYHPDVNPDDEAAQVQYRAINEAVEVLGHPEARAKYDRLHASWNANKAMGNSTEFDWSGWTTTDFNSNQEATNSDDILIKPEKDQDHSPFFAAVFGDMQLGQPGITTPSKGEDYTQQVEFTLEEAFAGASRILRIGGRRIEVRIPKGADTGTKVRIRGEGADGLNGGPKGDLYLEIAVKPHPNFERSGDDLNLDLPVTVYSAVLGGEAIVPTLKGKIKLKIPPETQSGRIFRLKGQGMPNLKNPEQRGDLYAKVMITVPQNLTDEEIELFEELADIRGL